jgi:tetratricopeptide (TPR) repeat protein
MGSAHAQRDEWDDALEAFDAALALAEGTSDEAAFEGNRAWALGHLGRGPEALVAADRALALPHDDDLTPRILLNRALAFSTLGRVPEALAVIEHAADLDPDDPDIAFDRAGYLARLDRRPEALTILALALSLDPSLAAQALTDRDVRLLAEQDDSAAAFAAMLATARQQARRTMDA